MMKPMEADQFVHEKPSAQTPESSNCGVHPAVLESNALFADRSELLIRHDGHEYRLRITRQNKLILTK